jgi:ATP-dependent Clp protease ATP-binding subunit ClpC
MFERFTEQSRRVVVLAQEEARMLGHNHIGSEHLLLGLLHEQGGTAADVLASAGITVEAARSEVEELAVPRDKSPTGHIPFTQRAKKILELSLREALEQRKSYIGTEHILLALMRDSDGMGARVLERLGGSLPALRQQVIDKVAEAAAPGLAEREPEHEMWAADWRHAQGGFAREARVPPPVAGFRQLLTPIDRRLAAIERHLGIAADEEAEAGFRGLLASVNRHLANIERHLGLSAEDAEKPGAADEEPGEESE